MASYQFHRTFDETLWDPKSKRNLGGGCATPLKNMVVKLDHLPKERCEKNKRYLKTPPSQKFRGKTQDKNRSPCLCESLTSMLLNKKNRSLQMPMSSSSSQTINPSIHQPWDSSEGQVQGKEKPQPQLGSKTFVIFPVSLCTSDFVPHLSSVEEKCTLHQIRTLVSQFEKTPPVFSETEDPPGPRGSWATSTFIFPTDLGPEPISIMARPHGAFLGVVIHKSTIAPGPLGAGHGGMN